MDAEQYQLLLYDFLRSQDQQKHITDLLMEMCESNILEFLGLNLMVYSKFQDLSLCNIAITLIYVQAKKGAIFASNEVAAAFWPNFAQVIPESFQSEIISENIKYIISSIMSYFATYFYRFNQDTQIQEFTLALFAQNPNFEPYIINTIEEIVVSSPDFGGFLLETLLKIITINPLQYEASTISRIKLYFSVVIRIFKNENEGNSLDAIKPQLINLFPVLFQATPPLLFDKMISTTALFAETFAEFFEPHLPTFIPLLCKFAKDANCSFRNSAIFCIESLTEGSIVMCSSYETYYIPVIRTLISIMTEINEAAPLEEDYNDNASYIIANNAIRTFLTKCENPAVYFFVNNLFKETIASISSTESNQLSFIYEKVPWPILHAFLYALSYRNYHLHIEQAAEFENKKEFESENGDETPNYIIGYVELTIGVLPFLTSPNCDAHLKIAIYDFISSNSISYNYLFYKYLSQTNFISIMISNILNESNFYLQKSCASSLSSYIKSGVGQYTENDYNEVFLYFSQNLQNLPLHLIIYFIRILKYFVFGTILKKHPETRSTFIGTIIDLYDKIRGKSATNNEYLDIQVEIFMSLIGLFERNFPKEILPDLFYSFQGLPDKVLAMLNDSIIISDQSLYTDEAKLQKKIINCIRLLGENAIPMIQQYNLLDRSISKSMEDISVFKYFQFDIVEEDESMLVKVGSNETGNKFFVLLSEQNEVNLALKMLIAIVPIVNPVDALDSLLQVCQKWITSEFHIEKLKKKSWILLIKMISTFISLSQAQALIQAFTDCFVNFFGFGTNKYNEILVNAMLQFMSIQIIDPTGANKSVPMILEKVANHADNLINKIAQSNIEMMNYKLVQKLSIYEDEMLPEVAFNRALLDSIAKLFHTALKKYTEETVLFFNQVYLQRLNLYMTKPESFEYAFQVKTYYVSRIGDVQEAVQLITCLFNFLVKCLKQVSLNASFCLAKLYRHIKLPNEFLFDLFQGYQSFLGRDCMCDSAESEYSDIGIGTFAIFIECYELQLKTIPPFGDGFQNLYENTIQTFIRALPVWDQSPYNDEVYKLVASLLEQQSRFIMNEDELSRIWIDVLLKIDDEMFMDNETSLRFRRIIKSMSSDPQSQVMLNCLFAEFGEAQKEIWFEISNEELNANMDGDGVNNDI